MTSPTPVTDERLRELRWELANGDALHAAPSMRKPALEHIAAIDELLSRRAADAQSSDAWVPVGERLPTGPKAVLVWCPERRNKYTAYLHELGHWIHFAHGGSVLNEEVTHWMPLPPPPSVDSACASRAAADNEVAP